MNIALLTAGGIGSRMQQNAAGNTKTISACR